MTRIRNRRTIASCATLAAAALVLILVLTNNGPAKPPPAVPPPPVGFVNIYTVRPGNYATAINIHNPSVGANPVTIYRRAVLALSDTDTPSAPSAFQSYSLGAGYAVEVNCTDIQTLLDSSLNFSTGFIQGFVTILSKDQLDVVGDYTAEPLVVASTPPSTPGIALQMLTIAPRIEFLGRSTTVAEPGTIYEYSTKFLCGNVPNPPQG